MIYRKLIILIMVCAGLIPAAWGQQSSRIMSLPHAISGENLYKVRIERIDGLSVPDRRYHDLAPGAHEIEVSLLLEVVWESNESVEPDSAAAHQMKLTLEGGKRYQVAGRVYQEASPEEVSAGQFWEAFVYRVDEVDDG